MSNEQIIFWTRVWFFGGIGLLLETYRRTLFLKNDANKELTFAFISFVAIVSAAVAKYLWL